MKINQHDIGDRYDGSEEDIVEEQLGGGAGAQPLGPLGDERNELDEGDEGFADDEEDRVGPPPPRSCWITGK